MAENCESSFHSIEVYNLVVPQRVGPDLVGAALVPDALHLLLSRPLLPLIKFLNLVLASSKFNLVKIHVVIDKSFQASLPNNEADCESATSQLAGGESLYNEGCLTFQCERFTSL